MDSTLSDRIQISISQDSQVEGGQTEEIVASQLQEKNTELIMMAMEVDDHFIQEKAGILSELTQELNVKEDEYRKQILHIETITMMAKYQLIYIKLENFWKKL